MNEKQFLKRLTKYNPNNFFTCNIVSDLINSQSNAVSVIKHNILKKFFNRFHKGKSVDKIIYDNLDIILERTLRLDKKKLLEIFIEDSKVREVIKSKFDEILEALRECDSNSKIMIAQLFNKCEDLKEINEKYMNEFIKDIIYSENFFDKIQMVKGISKDIDAKAEKLLESRQEEIAIKLLYDAVIYKQPEDYLYEKELNRYAITLSTIIKEIMESEGKGWIDFTFKGKGGYNDVYEIGEKVIKIGIPRKTYNIPNHPRLLQPLIRTNCFADKDGEVVLACIEVCDKVELLEKEKEFCKKDKNRLYQIYKELREDGIIWTDARFANIGILNRDNIPNVNGEEMYVSPDSVGFNNELKQSYLKKGDWVIIDTDYIFSKEDPNIKWSAAGFSKEFEERWQREQQCEIAQKIKKEPKVKRYSKEEKVK